MSKHRLGTKFDTLGHIAAEILVILYIHPLIFLRSYLSFLKFSLIFMNIVALLTNRVPLDKFISSIWVAKVMPCYLFTIQIYLSN